MSVDTRQKVGLPVATTGLMFGVVFAANPGRFGVAGATAGILVAALSTIAAVWLFRSGGSRGRPASVDQPQGSEDT